MLAVCKVRYKDMAGSDPGHVSFLAAPAGLEPTANGLENRCSIHLSYGAARIQFTTRSGAPAAGLAWTS